MFLASEVWSIIGTILKWVGIVSLCLAIFGTILFVIAVTVYRAKYKTSAEAEEEDLEQTAILEKQCQEREGKV